MPWSAKSVLYFAAMTLAIASRSVSAADARTPSTSIPSAPSNTFINGWQSITIPLPESEPTVRQIRFDGNPIDVEPSPQPPAQVRRDAPNRPAVARRPATTLSGQTATRQPAPRADQDNSIGSRRLTPPGASPQKEAGKPTAPSAGGTIVTTISSLMIVLGLFFVCVWFMRRSSRSATTHLPDGVLQVLGRSSFAGKQQLYLVRLGNKLLLLSVTAGGSEPLAEITDPMEVDRIAGLCQQNQPGSVAASFRQVFTQLSHSSKSEGDEPRGGNRRIRTTSLSGNSTR